MPPRQVPQHLKEAHTFLVNYQSMTLPAISKFLKKSGLLEKEFELKGFIQLPNRDSIVYSLPTLTIVSQQMQQLRNTRPVGSNVKHIELGIEFGIQNDQLYSSVNVLIVSDSQDPTYCCFHIDTMPNNINANRFAHPFHHFQFGGERLADFGFANQADFGRLIFLDTPRISMPPMDLSIALHFICTNFLPKQAYDIRGNAEFETQIKNAQTYLWKPFYSSISSYWHAGDKKKAENYLPQLVG